MMLEARRLFTIHVMMIGGFALTNVPIAIMDALGHHSLLGYSRLMRLEEEANIPSAFSALALVACAIAASANFSRLAQEDPDRSAWGVLATFFGFLALDEVAMLHELGNRVGLELALGGWLKIAGVFFYVPVVVWLTGRLFPFWLRQEPYLRAALLTGACIYVAGAIGCELIEHKLESLGYGNYDLPLRISFIFEECGEMLGVAVFLYAFLYRFSALGGGLLVRLAVPDARAEVRWREDPVPQANAPALPAQKMPISSMP